MKILMIGVASMDTGGIENYLMSIYRNTTIPKKNIDFLVHTNKIGCLESEIIGNGSVIHKLPRLSSSPIKYAVQLYQTIKINNYDIVHRHSTGSIMWIDLLVAKVAGCRIRIAHSHNSDWGHRLIHYIGRPLLNLVSNHKLACGIKAGKWMYGENKKFIVKNNCIDLPVFKFDQQVRVRKRNELGIVESKKNFVVIGRLVKEKNHKFLIEAIVEAYKVNNNMKFLFVGDGPLYLEIDNLIRNLDATDYIELLGNRSDVPEILNSADVLLMPSIFEGFPISAIEAQCNGLYCLISDEVTSEVNIDGNTIFIPLKTNLWIENILYLSQLDDSDRFDTRAEAWKIIRDRGYSQYDSAMDMTEMYLKAYEEVCCGR